MTETSAKAHTADRYHLRTLGTLALAGPEDATLLGKHGHQRRRMALLAVLAAAGEQGRSRDQLLLLFWPDATQSHARHSLEQLLYAIRSSIDEAVFAGVNPVRLNPDVVSSDVGEYQSALQRGDLAGAVELYRGPFLDGFYLSDTPEFERWVDAERARLNRSYVTALEQMAQNAEAAYDHATGLRWWRKLAETDPVSSKNAIGVIRGLMNAGDHAAALQYAQHYEAVLAQELGTSVGPAVAHLVAEVRAKAKTERVAVMKSPPAAQSRPRAVLVAAGATPVDQPQPRRYPLRRSASYVFGALAIFGVMATVARVRTSLGHNVPRPVEERSIAVLPFANVSGDQQDAALVDGVTEELIAVLSRIPNLRVIARTSAFAFRNSNAGVRRIADSLGVSNVLEGGVQRAGSRLRVQVRLVDARDGSTRWSEVYDRELKDIFSLQSDIAGAVARELDLRLGETALARIKRGSTRNVAAYELYLRGNDPVRFRTDSAALAALEYFRQAVALDSNYAAAYAGLALMHKRIAFGDDPEQLSRPDRLALAEQAALKAIALDDSSGEAHEALGYVRRDNYELTQAETEFKRAVALDPTNSRFHEGLVQIYTMTQRPDEALVEARRAVDLDPLSPTANAEVADALLANDRCDEALLQLETLRSLQPPLNRANQIAAECYGQKGMWPEAIAEIQRITVNGGPRVYAYLGYTLGRAGRTEEARRILAVMLDRSRRTKGGAFDVALVYAGLGENDQAFTWLDKAVDDRSLGFEWMHATVNGLRSDPRFEKLGRRAGLQKP